MGNKFFMGVAALAAAGSVFGADRLSATEKVPFSCSSMLPAPFTSPTTTPLTSSFSLRHRWLWQSYDMGFSLTANQIATFDSACYDLAMPLGASDCSMYVWAVNNDNAQIRWNHLSGGIIGGGAYASAAALQGSNGDTVGVAGTINMDGVEYSSAFNGYTVNFAASTGDLDIDLLRSRFR